MYNINLDKSLDEVLNATLKHIEDNEAYILTTETAEWNKHNAVATIEHLSFVVEKSEVLKELKEKLEEEGVNLEYRTFREPVLSYNRLIAKVYTYLYIPKQ